MQVASNTQVLRIMVITLFGPIAADVKHLQDQWHRALRLLEDNPERDRQWPPSKLHRRSASMELQAVKLSWTCCPATSYYRLPKRQLEQDLDPPSGIAAQNPVGQEVRQNWIAASENTDDRPARPLCDASKVISFSRHPLTHAGMHCRATERQRATML